MLKYEATVLNNLSSFCAVQYEVKDTYTYLN